MALLPAGEGCISRSWGAGGYDPGEKRRQVCNLDLLVEGIVQVFKILLEARVRSWSGERDGHFLDALVRLGAHADEVQLIEDGLTRECRVVLLEKSFQYLLRVSHRLRIKAGEVAGPWIRLFAFRECLAH